MWNSRWTRSFRLHRRTCRATLTESRQVTITSGTNRPERPLGRSGRNIKEIIRLNSNGDLMTHIPEDSVPPGASGQSVPAETLAKEIQDEINRLSRFSTRGMQAVS